MSKDSKDSGQLVAAAYQTHDDAKTILDMLQQMHRAVTITLIDAAVISKNEEGKVKVHETDELTVGKGARRGAIVTGVLGLIYPPSLIVSLVTGGVIGGLAGKLRDTGVKNDTMKEIAGHLDAGKFAVVALVSAESVPVVQDAMNSLHATLIVQPLSEEQMKEIYLAAEADR